MANSGIKIDQDALDVANIMKKNKSMKGFFMAINKEHNAVVPDRLEEGMFDELSFEEMNFPKPKKPVQQQPPPERVQTDECFRKTVSSCAFFKGDIMEKLQERCQKEPKYAVLNINLCYKDGQRDIAKDVLLFVSWSPDESLPKLKMLSSSTKQSTYLGIGKVLPSMNQMEANAADEISLDAVICKCFKEAKPPIVTEFDSKKVEQKKGQGYVFKTCD